MSILLLLLQLVALAVVAVGLALWSVPLALVVTGTLVILAVERNRPPDESEERGDA